MFSLSLFGCLATSQPTVAFMSDFGTTDDSVAVCKGEMIRVDPQVRVVDLTHQVTPYSLAEAARFLAGSMPDFPAGTVFLCVVDPGVGSDREPIAVRLTGEVIGLDGPYGNLLTNVSESLFAKRGYKIGDEVTVSSGGRTTTLPFVRTFSDVPEGQPLLYIDSRGRLSAAINMGNFAKVNGIEPPVTFTIAAKK